MALPHVNAGDVARAAEQNTLIDAVNDNATTLDINAGTLGTHESRLDVLEGSTSFARWENHNGAALLNGVIPMWMPFDRIVNSSPDVTANAAMDTFTINTPGVYGVNCSLRWTGSPGAGARAAFISLNGSSVMGDALSGADTNPGTAMSDNSVSTFAYLAAGDFIRFMVFQNSGDTLSTAGTRINYISLARLF